MENNTNAFERYNLSLYRKVIEIIAEDEARKRRMKECRKRYYNEKKRERERKRQP